MRKPTGKLVYFKEQKPTRYKAFDVIVDSYNLVHGYVSKENGWIVVVFTGKYNEDICDFEFVARDLKKGEIVTENAYLFNRKTKKMLETQGRTYDSLTTVKKMASNRAHKVLVDFLNSER